LAIRDLWLASAGSGSGGKPLRVVSANVLASSPTPEKVLAFVRANGADLVVLVDARDERWDGVLAALGELYPPTGR
jgi:endonuclease/exonuclease/phosphatase (EEP) superfamily protein YafD